MIPHPFEYHSPGSLREAVSLLSSYRDEAKVLAGGQSLLSILKLRLADPRCLIDLGRISELNYIREEEASPASADRRAGAGTISIGALTPYVAIKDSALLRRRCPLLPRVASVVGDVQVRNRGTLGGSLAHADPAGDMPAAILALRAELKAVGSQGERWIKAEDFFLGLLATALEPDEILTEIRVPATVQWRTAYLKAARRPSDFALVGVAVCLKNGAGELCEEATVALTGVTDKAYRATGVEEKLRGTRLAPESIRTAVAGVVAGVDVNDSIHASSRFRSHLARVYAARAIEAAS